MDYDYDAEAWFNHLQGQLPQPKPTKVKIPLNLSTAKVPKKGELEFKFKGRPGSSLYQLAKVFKEHQFHYHVKLLGTDPSGPIDFSVELPPIDYSEDEINDMIKQCLGRRVLRGHAFGVVLGLAYGRQELFAKDEEFNGFAPQKTRPIFAEFDPETSIVTGTIPAGFLEPGVALVQKDRKIGDSKFVFEGNQLKEVHVPLARDSIIGWHGKLPPSWNVQCILQSDERKLLIKPDDEGTSLCTKAKRSCKGIITKFDFPYHQLEPGDDRGNGYMCPTRRSKGEVAVISLQENIRIVEK